MLLYDMLLYRTFLCVAICDMPPFLCTKHARRPDTSRIHPCGCPRYTTGELYGRYATLGP